MRVEAKGTPRRSRGDRFDGAVFIDRVMTDSHNPRVASKPLGLILREVRERRGLTQQEVARRASITQAYLAKLETGDKDNPSLDIVRRLARALKVPLGELLE
jgi:DNA-binding XRE family transcriptional regulator